jgi:hypothetical protein
MVSANEDGSRIVPDGVTTGKQGFIESAVWLTIWMGAKNIGIFWSSDQNESL